MNKLTYETIFYINSDKISLSRINFFIMEMEEYGISMEIKTDADLQNAYKVMVQRRNIGPEFRVIAQYIQEHDLEVYALHQDEVWIEYTPEFYAKVKGIENIFQQKDIKYNCKSKYDSNDLSTIF